MDRFHTVLLSAVLLAGCASDDEPPEPPELARRDLPAFVAPPPAMPRDAGPHAPPAVELPTMAPCCEIALALRDQNGMQDEATAYLRGPDSPLNSDEPIELTFVEGSWTASVCLPIGFEHQYFYEFGLTPDSGDEELFIETRVNANAPQFESGLHGTVNIVLPFEDCDEDFAPHADTSAE